MVGESYRRDCEDKTWVLGFSSAAGSQPILKPDTQIFICAQDMDEAVPLDGNNSRSTTPTSANPFLDGSSYFRCFLLRECMKVALLESYYHGTTFILPQWLIAKGPGMECRSHKTILAMFAAYSIVSVVLSVVLATPFFVDLTQQALPWHWKCCAKVDSSDVVSSNRNSTVSQLIPLGASILGSIGIALAAPLLAGISIVKNHPTANRWVIIAQWSTRPRASIFVWAVNLLMAKRSRSRHQHETDGDTEIGGFTKTAYSSIASELVVTLFGIRFLWEQASIPPGVYDPSLPCKNDPSSSPGSVPDNCPAMQQGAIGLLVATIINTVLILFTPCCGAIALFVVPIMVLITVCMRRVGAYGRIS